jgi:hypothetical protein
LEGKEAATEAATHDVEFKVEEMRTRSGKKKKFFIASRKREKIFLLSEEGKKIFRHARRTTRAFFGARLELGICGSGC